MRRLYGRSIATDISIILNGFYAPSFTLQGGANLTFTELSEDKKQQKYSRGILVLDNIRLYFLELWCYTSMW